MIIGEHLPLGNSQSNNQLQIIYQDFSFANKIKKSGSDSSDEAPLHENRRGRKLNHRPQSLVVVLRSFDSSSYSDSSLYVSEEAIHTLQESDLSMLFDNSG